MFHTLNWWLFISLSETFRRTKDKAKPKLHTFMPAKASQNRLKSSISVKNFFISWSQCNIDADSSQSHNKDYCVCRILTRGTSSVSAVRFGFQIDCGWPSMTNTLSSLMVSLTVSWENFEIGCKNPPQKTKPKQRNVLLDDSYKLNHF